MHILYLVVDMSNLLIKWLTSAIDNDTIYIVEVINMDEILTDELLDFLANEYLYIKEVMKDTIELVTFEVYLENALKRRKRIMEKRGKMNA